MTVWRSVSEVMVQRIGPAPKLKNASAAIVTDGQTKVATISAIASTDIAGPIMSGPVLSVGRVRTG